MILDRTRLDTPIGPLALYALDDALVALSLGGSSGRDTPHERFLARHLGAFTTRPREDAAGAATRLRRYFAGELTSLDEQLLRITGTPFQRETWMTLRGVGPGHTLSYAELAARLGRPRAVRAVAAANGANPLALFVPCHRVIAADGTLWGYGGGLPMKQWLLRHEGATFTPLASQEALAL
jgi:methylated-DNA-[protein]-cysteine S-methyltransferase